MVNADLEIDRLRYLLIARGFTIDETDAICDQASREIADAVVDQLANSMIELASDAANKGANEYVQHMTIRPSANAFVITTYDGQTDFSTPPFPMRDSLLKNPKVAADGTLYKVIPVGAPSERSGKSLSLMDLQDRINDARKQAQSYKDNNSISGGSSPSVGEAVARFSELASKNLANAREQSIRKSQNVRGTSFRTVTSKQDAKTKWIQPEKQRDMTQATANQNELLADTIDSIIMSIIRKYEES
jgi:hypothetical protein